MIKCFHLPTWITSACRVTKRVIIRGLYNSRFLCSLVTMNSHLHHGMHYPFNYVGAGFMPQAGSTPFYPGNLGYNHYRPDYSRTPFQPPYFAGQSVSDKAISTAYYQFFFNYLFQDSERFHPRTPHKQQRIRGAHTQTVRIRRSASSSNIQQGLQDEILQLKAGAKKLNIRGGSIESVATESTGSSTSLGSSKVSEDSPDCPDTASEDGCVADSDKESQGDAGEEDDESDEDNMHPRGIKRQPDQRGRSPIQKRPRSEERDNSLMPRTKGPWSIPQGGLNKDEYQKLSDTTLDFYERHEQAQEMYVKKMKLRDALYAVMRGVFPYCGLYVVGSSMNGFGSNSSDMDLCLMLSYSEIDQKKEATEILKMLHKSLKKCTFLKEITLIRAKVPILKFRDKISDVECDLNINNSVGIRNTHLLNAYSKLDWRVSCLVVFVKHWAKCQNINDASQGTISSYSLVLMVLHYLQCGCTPPVVPSLQQKYPHKFSISTDIRHLTLNEKLPPYTSPNKQIVGELFYGFLDYYANKFDFEEDAVSIRLGRKMKRDVVCTQNIYLNHPSQWKFLCIEEPFNLSNTARSVFDRCAFDHIRSVFRKSHAKLRQTGNVNHILDQPL